MAFHAHTDWWINSVYFNYTLSDYNQNDLNVCVSDSREDIIFGTNVANLPRMYLLLVSLKVRL